MPKTNEKRKLIKKTADNAIEKLLLLEFCSEDVDKSKLEDEILDKATRTIALASANVEMEKCPKTMLTTLQREKLAFEREKFEWQKEKELLNLKLKEKLADRKLELKKLERELKNKSKVNN